MKNFLFVDFDDRTSDVVFKGWMIGESTSTKRLFDKSNNKIIVRNSENKNKN